MELRLLGPVQVRVGDTAVDLGPRQQRLVLAVLAWDVDRVVPIERLVEWLWPGEPPRSATHAIQVQVSNLRSLLAKAGAAEVAISTQGPGYRLHADPMRIDVHRFQRWIEQARGTRDDRRKVTLLEQALSLWTGPALADTATPEVRERLCGGLAETRLVAQEDRFDSLLRLGHHHNVLGELTTLVETHPTRERLVCQLMLARYRGGQAGHALDMGRQTRAHLAEELGIDPGRELRQLELAILRNDPALDPPPRQDPVSSTGEATPAPSLPCDSLRGLPAPRTRLIGRDREVTESVERLTTGGARLLTLTGPGGVGKTRLALEISARLASCFTNGVVLVLLAPLSDPDLVLSTIASSLGIQDMGGRPLRETLQVCLRTRHTLILLDNMEHVLDAAPEIGSLLDAAPRLTILATSRAPLGLHGEHVRPVEPLAAPAAIDLFTERANQASPVTEDFDPLVVDAICHRLDRLPLVIELAAARTRLLPLAALLGQLGQSHDLLAGGARDRPHRQRTLRSTIAWSYDLLDADEQAMLGSVAIFAGGWTVEAAAAIADVDQAGTLELLSRLLDSSLITRQQVRGTDEARFTMLETIRTFALARSEEDAGRARHAAYFEDFAKTARAGVEGPGQRVWLDRLLSEHDNLRAAMRWLLDHGRLDRFAGIFVFWQLWVIKGRFSECRRWAGEALTAADGSLGASPRAGVLAMFGVALYGSSPGEAVQAVGESVRVAKQTGDLATQAMALLHRGYVAAWAEDHETAELVFGEAANAMGRLGWTSSLATARVARAHAITMLGRHEEAHRLLVEIETQLRCQGGPYELASALNYRGLVLLQLGEAEGAERVLREAVAICDRLGASLTMMYALDFLAATAALGGRPERSARLAGAASVLIDRFGPSMIVQFQQQHRRTKATAMAETGQDKFDALFEEGRRMTWDQVVAMATSA
ncbi:winged helix-turn-helix domain-containing protein [Amycolatopsis sp. NBC_00345]|uniref:BTAD domain-containing putative transcriptional regulator n=1 Tax=Amycolatopsis sp. NBC_00345 TaxID=2975955 RepID=UPI002E26B7D5